MGIESLDLQHKELVSLINELYTNIHSGSTTEAVKQALDKLIEYTDIHFKIEEDLFRIHNYSEMDKHKELHSTLVTQVGTKVIRLYHVERLARIISFWQVENSPSSNQIGKLEIKAVVDGVLTIIMEGFIRIIIASILTARSFTSSFRRSGP